MAGYPDIVHLDTKTFAESEFFSVTKRIKKIAWGTLFCCGDYEYAVHIINRTTWIVHKYNFSGNHEKYIVTRNKANFNCNCRSGLNNRNCRHREMVILSLKLKFEDKK